MGVHSLILTISPTLNLFSPSWAANFFDFVTNFLYIGCIIFLSTNTVIVEDKIYEKPVETIEELDAVQLEIDKEELRNHRNILLMESDWTQNRDVVLSNDEEWKTYRQALRDLPANTSDWRNPTYPTKPS